MCPWVSYLVADGLMMSGIVAILVNGIFLNYYAVPNISESSRHVVKIAIETLAYTTETMVFLFLGIGVFTFSSKYQRVTTSTIIFSLINFNLARFLNIYIVTWIVNRARSEESKVSGKHQFVLWISGLRGAMAYALAMEASHSRIFNDPAKGKYSGDVMLIVTILYSLFTILGVSSFLNPMMQKLGVTKAAKVEDQSKTSIEKDLINQI